MDFGTILILVVLGLGIVYSARKRKQAPAKPSNDGWKGLGVLAVLFAGLFVADATKSEGLTWLFGLSLMIAVPMMLIFAIGSSIGSRLRKGDDEER